MRLHTMRRRALRRNRYKPVECPRHHRPYRGAGWVYAAGLRFAMFECPAPGCKRFKLLGDESATVPQFDADLF